MKKGLLYLVAALAIGASSCRKDVASGADLTLSQAGSAAITNTSSAISLSRRTSNYGALIDAPDHAADAYTFIVDVAGELGLSCLRDKTPVPSSKKVQTLTSGYNILLNFSTNAPQPMSFRTDIARYKTDLTNTVNSLSAKPMLAVIENEESNKKYFKGSPIEYVNQLQAAIEVMHGMNIPVANGGITSVGLKYLVYQDYLSRGMIEEANDYKMRMKIAVKSPDTQDRAAFISVLLANYAVMDLDYVNFHWRSTKPEDAQGLGETIDYLKRVTGKKVITNEMGQYDQVDETLTASVDMCRSYGLPFVIWYSGSMDRRSYPLQHADETLTNTGVAYRNFIANK